MHYIPLYAIRNVGTVVVRSVTPPDLRTLESSSKSSSYYRQNCVIFEELKAKSACATVGKSV